MMSINPYESPADDEVAEPVKLSSSKTTAAKGASVPRYIAANIDWCIVMVLSVLATKALPDRLPLLQVGAAVATFLGYYLVPEWLFSKTPGKLLTGLVVVQLDGRRVTWWQAVVRTVSRLLEVNPILLGGLPAVVCIMLSKRRQRLGDLVAGTVVVPVVRKKKRV